MMLIGNYTVRNKSPGRFFGGTSSAGGAEASVRSNFGGASRRGIHYQAQSSEAAKAWGTPTGGYAEVSWMFPYLARDLVAHNRAQGAATATATIIEGRPIAASASGVSTATATGQLVVSGAGTAAGSATTAGNLKAAISSPGTAAGEATATGTLTAKAWAVGSSAGISDATLVRYAIGQLSGSIAPAVVLDAGTFSTYLLDDEDVETGLTLRQALRLIAAAAAGKVSGASGTTISIRSAVGDDIDRIIATVDSNGNRSSITYNLN